MNTKGVAFLTIAATLAVISVTVFLIEWESSPLIILFVVLGLLAIVSNLILVSKLFAMYQKSKRQVQSVLYEKECMADAMENIRKEMQQQNLQLSEFEVIRKNLQKFKSFPDIQSDSSINEDFGKIISFLLNLNLSPVNEQSLLRVEQKIERLTTANQFLSALYNTQWKRLNDKLAECEDIISPQNQVDIQQAVFELALPLHDFLSWYARDLNYLNRYTYNINLVKNQMQTSDATFNEVPSVSGNPYKCPKDVRGIKQLLTNIGVKQLEVFILGYKF